MFPDERAGVSELFSLPVQEYFPCFLTKEQEYRICFPADAGVFSVFPDERAEVSDVFPCRCRSNFRVLSVFPASAAGA